MVIFLGLSILGWYFFHFRTLNIYAINTSSGMSFCREVSWQLMKFHMRTVSLTAFRILSEAFAICSTVCLGVVSSNLGSSYLGPSVLPVPGYLFPLVWKFAAIISSNTCFIPSSPSGILTQQTLAQLYYSIGLICCFHFSFFVSAMLNWLLFYMHRSFAFVSFGLLLLLQWVLSQKLNFWLDLFIVFFVKWSVLESVSFLHSVSIFIASFW